MIAACPRCSARYRIEKGRLGPEGARLRCSQCQAVFRVRPPESEAAAEAPARAPVAPEPPAAAQRAPEAPAPARRAAEPSAPAERPVESPQPSPEPGDRERLVLIADPVIDDGKVTASALASWGLKPLLVHDGVEAILTIQRTLPRAVIIDAALPKMYGFQICELLKRNESLRHIHVVLVGAIHDRARYRRPPTELYGADAYLERQQLPDAVRPILQGWGLPLGGVSEPEPVAAPAPAVETVAPPAPAVETAAPPEPPLEPAPAPAPRPAVEPAAPEPAEPVAAAAPSAPSGPAADSEVAKAERLARIVVSDIILYNQEKFDAAVKSGDVESAMDAELAEGRALFAQRIDARVRESRDFLGEELQRMARLRRTQ